MNGDLARSRRPRSARTEGGDPGRNERRDPDRAVEPRRGIGDVPGWRENATQRFEHRASGDRIAGPGQTSREARHRILRRAPDDGRHPGSHGAARVHARVVPETSAAPPPRRADAPNPRGRCAESRREGARALRGGGEATGVSEARSSPAPWSRQRPRPLRIAQRESRRTEARRSGRGCREAPPPLVVSLGPQSPGGLPDARASERARNARGTGSRRSFGWQMSVGCIDRLFWPVGRKTLRAARAIAGRKRTAPLTRSVRGEKANRCTSLRASSRSS